MNARLWPDAVPVVRRQSPGHAVARIAFKRRPDGAVGLADLYQAAPLRLLRPRPLEEAVGEAVLANVGGGLVGGDRQDVTIVVEDDARALVTSQAAEKVYRSLGEDVVVRTRLEVGADAVLEWLPQEAILFDGARLDRRTEAHVAAGGTLLAAESIVFGRTAHGERFTHGRLAENWRVVRAGRAAWADALLIEDDVRAIIDHPAGLAGAGALATIVFVADDAAARLDAMRALLDAAPCRAGATMAGGVLVARLMDPDAGRVRTAFRGVVTGFRSEVLGRLAALPRVWSC